MATLFELKEKMQTVQDAINEDRAFITEKAADPAFDLAQIEEKEKHLASLEKRLDLLQKEHDRMETAQKAQIEKQVKETPTSDKEHLVKAKADFYRTAMMGGDVRKTYEGLGGIPASDGDLGYGDKLLPKNVSNQLLTEPVESNPLRGICRVTNVSGLEEPKLGFEIEDTDIGDVTDKQTAKEIETEGDTVVYGRLKMKVKATVKDTVLHGTDLDVVGAVEGNLRSALAKREKHFAFLDATSCGTDTAHAHMSFYNEVSGASVIKEVEGESLYEAIVNAYADLGDDYAANAIIVMRKVDYYGIIKELSNTSDTLFTGKPAAILGVPVVFCEGAEIPVVGDFSFYGINYDIGSVFDTDKDVDKGEYKFVFTAWGDQQIRMKSAFRLAVVNP